MADVGGRELKQRLSEYLDRAERGELVRVTDRARRVGRGPRQVSLYVDSSALLKRYVDEPDSDAAESLLRSDASLLTARNTIVEVRRNLARLLDEPDGAAIRSAFMQAL